MFASHDRLVIFDVDGTLVDAFHAIETAFSRHEMDLGDLKRFQRRRKLFKYLGGLREFPKNLRQQFGKQHRKRLLQTLTDIYRDEARLYAGMAGLLRAVMAAPDIRVGIVTRNVTRDPEHTLRQLFARHEVDFDALDFTVCLPLSDEKTDSFLRLTRELGVNPARGHACGDEFSDYHAATRAGLHPLIAAYGFEDAARLRDVFSIPEPVIARTPDELIGRLCHTLDLPLPDGRA